MEHAITQVELADNDTTAQLLLMTIPARTDVIRKGIEYTARERQCVADALDTQHAAQRTALETEKAQITRTYDLRIEHLQNTIHELKTRIDEDKYKAQEMAMTMINNHTEQQESLIVRIEAQHAQDIHRATQEHDATKQELDATKQELQTHRERFGQGATCTSGNAAKGHEGEQHVMKLLEEYMPLVKRSYDHHHANETGKNAVGHSADIGITCNGIDVLIEVKNSDYPIRKKEIEKAERDLQEQPSARLLVLISWQSRFQKETIHERDATYETHPNNKLIIFMPNFKMTCEESSGVVLATTIVNATASMRALDMQQGVHADIPCAMQQCKSIQETFNAQVKLAKSISREADAIVKHAKTGIRTHIDALMNAIVPTPTTGTPTPTTGTPTVVTPTPTTGTPTVVTPTSHTKQPEQPEHAHDTPYIAVEDGPSDETHTAPAVVVDDEPPCEDTPHTNTPYTNTPHTNTDTSTTATAKQRTRRNKKEMEKSVSVIKGALQKDGGTKLTVEDMVNILAAHDDTGYERLKVKWDINGIRTSLTTRLAKHGCIQHADKTWCIKE